MKNWYYFVFAVAVVAFSMIFFSIKRESNKKNPALTEIATEPDILITSADHYLQEDKRLTAISFLEDAISTMRLLEKNGDSVSNLAIEHAIRDLKVVEDHIKLDDIDNSFMYDAYADAMNSLAYASLRISENLIEQGEEAKAEKTLNYAMIHLQNSIKYAKGGQKEDEIKIAQQLKDIITNHRESDVFRIEEVMREIDSVVQHHVIK